MKNNLGKSGIYSVIVFAFVASPIFAYAQSTDATIQQLQAQIKALQTQVETLTAQVKEARATLNLTRPLLLGSQGDDVKELQTFFRESYPDLYTGPITGYFGPITEAAVKRLQARE